MSRKSGRTIKENGRIEREVNNGTTIISLEHHSAVGSDCLVDKGLTLASTLISQR